MILLQTGLDNTDVDAVQEAAEQAFNLTLYDPIGFGELMLRFLLMMVFIWIIVYFMYYRRSKRRDYFFTFILLSVTVFFLIYLLGSVKVKIGFALGLFAIFGILRYRTETIPVREMTYMFSVIGLSVINALADNMSLAELLAPNVIITVAIGLFELFVLRRSIASKLVLYDRIALITPEKREELIEDLRQRTGLNVFNVVVGSIDFLKDSAVLKIYYENDGGGASHINHRLKPAKYEWQEVKEQ